MKMEPRDVMGNLYSEAGLRFGGFPTTDFLVSTEPLEEKSPGIRERIVAEAHYLVHWLHKFPEIAFFFGIVLYKSLWVALLLFVVAFVFEIIRFYVFGPSPFLSRICKIWNLIKIPLFIVASIILWHEGISLSIILITFLLIQGCFGLVSCVGMFPIRLIAVSIIYKKFGGHCHNIEGMAMSFVINRWRLKLFPADRFNIGK